ncbi:hypothetical protein [Lactococcus formosensis]|uniref:Uncharacterized protein n=1 Tax=Lactococcus formosensis TaxID=1281486 RepID=A0A9X4P7U8_9LACT|nr:hypothetical protein [Lactococcus formosensis]MDG6142313.1 hypothetical protein [Lactococcus formosensis]MDG6155119.1 hypothetical protein [Lactococcus formosensis]MDG6159518.1 hypothetical protein [Lactococcus formosensis]MDG6165752.1 hypothetical protein [Lactococcus formosensis]MDG6172205.1 hypothetical protein [Lactococcus formosensis]
MKKKILTWPMFIYSYSALIIFIFILDYFVVCLSSIMVTLPTDNNELVIPFMFYHVALIVAPINYLIERCLANDRKRKWSKGLLYLGTCVITVLLGSLNLEIKLKNYLIFIIIYVVIFTLVSLKYKFPKSLKWYLD